MTTTTDTDRATARTPDQLCTLLAAYTTAGDVGGLASLFEPDALVLGEPGRQARGADQLHTACAALCALAARVEAQPDTVHVSGDLALTTSSWTARTGAGGSYAGRASQVARRQSDGRWLAVIGEVSWRTS